MLILTAIENSVTAVLAGFTEVFTWIITQMGDVVTFVLGQPLLFIPIGFVVARGLVNLFKRIF